MSLVKLNLAGGPARFGHGWINIDLAVPTPEQRALLNVQADLIRGVPVRRGSVDVLYVSHFLEHLGPFEESDRFLRECLDVLKPGGRLRISVPDMRKIALIYLRDPREFYAEYDYEKPWFSTARTWGRRLGISVMYGHKMLFDYAALSEVLQDAGFGDICEVEADLIGGLPAEVTGEITPTHLTHSLIVDCARPG